MRTGWLRGMLEVASFLIRIYLCIGDSSRCAWENRKLGCKKRVDDPVILIKRITKEIHVRKEIRKRKEEKKLVGIS